MTPDRWRWNGNSIGVDLESKRATLNICKTTITMPISEMYALYRVLGAIFNWARQVHAAGFPREEE